MIERIALLLYWRLPGGRRIVRGYIHDATGVTDVHLRRGWNLTRWRRPGWRLERS